MRRSYLSVLFVLIPSLFTLLAACEQPEPPQTLVLVVTATSNEPRPTLSPRIVGLINKAAASDSGTVLVTYPDDGRLVTAKRFVVTPFRRRGEVEHVVARRAQKIAGSVTAIRAAVTKIQPRQPGLDLITAFARMPQPGGVRTIAVLSSGLSTVAPTDWRTMGFGLDTRRQVSDLRSRGYRPELGGDLVLFSGLTETVPPQRALPEPVAATLQGFWLRFCREAHGDCQVDASYAAADVKPSTTVLTPVVPVPAVCTRVLPGHRAEISVPDPLLGFRGNSALLPRSADRVLRPIARELTGLDQVRVAGHTADYGDLSGQLGTSRARARAVIDRLVQLGVSRSVFSPRSGAGDGPRDPVPGYVGTAPINRRVTFAVNRSVQLGSGCLAGGAR